MTVEQKIAKFSRENEPFYISDYNGSYTLCHNFFSQESIDFCQSAFDRYAKSVGDPLTTKYGLRTHGSGYEWEYAFRKAFENDPEIGQISYDSEGDGFYCYSRNLDLMIRLGEQFREICKDEDAFYTLLTKAIPEGERMTAESIHLGKTFKGFLMDNPDADIDVKTPMGRLHITPETGNQLLNGNITEVIGNGFKIAAQELLDMKTGKKNLDLFEDNHYQVAVDYFDEQELAEDFHLSM